MIKADFINRVRGMADIAYIVNELWPLKKAGANYKACCPFHDENSPSFNVNSAKQIYKCFGCGAGGDVFSFVQNYKQCNFSEAVIYVAGRYNELVEYEHTNSKPRSRFHNLKLR